MIATPGQRNRLMQKLRAETCVRRKSGIAMSGTDERVHRKEGIRWGLCPQTPGIYRFDAIPVDNFVAGAQFITEPQPGLGPGVGAQVASRQSLILRSGRLKCIRKSGIAQW